MKSKRRLMGVLLLLLLVGTAHADVSTEVSLLYERLDMAIEHTDEYVKVRKGRIGKLKNDLQRSRQAEAKYHAAFNLYQEYHSYKSDSAVYYLSQCITYARQAKNPQAEGNAKALLAFQCSTTGKYTESLSLLTKMDTTLLDKQGMCNYLRACQHVYGELRYYANIGSLKKYYEGKASEYDRLLLANLDPQDDYYLQLKEVMARDAHNYKEAFRLNDLRLKRAKEGSHQYAIVAYYRSLIYRRKGEINALKYWLLQSALCDVKLAVMDQGSLWEIANLLSKEPNGLQRSYRYIKFAWKAANTFNTAVRSSQIMPVLSTIEDSYQQELSESNQRMKAMIGISVLLIVVVLCLLYYVNKQRIRLASAHAKVKKTVAELKAANESLNESSKMKEVYIGRFLRLSANYMDKLEAMRKRVAKLVKNREFVKLNAMLQPNEENADEFYEYFDSAFLKLFPDFVHDFNELLRPEERIVLPEENRLTTTIRIFALIRLGIEDSSKIAEFLHYSVNTIYNYRAKVKNGALVDRDTFEERVKQIGMK